MMLLGKSTCWKIVKVSNHLADLEIKKEKVTLPNKLGNQTF